jgi:hypothetical protein
MNSRIWLVVAVAVSLAAAIACSKNHPSARVIVEVPPGFTGNFFLEMGVKDAPPLEIRGDAYLVTVPRSGKVVTSTLIINPKPTFQNSSDGGIWGYSHSIFTTGDGIPTGGKLEFFVGTRKDYEAEEGKRNHSEGFYNLSLASGA